MAFKIEDAIPIPRRQRGGPPKGYPLREMEIGQSFFVPGKTSHTIRGSLTATTRRLGRRFTARNVTEGGVKGVRVWRVG